MSIESEHLIAFVAGQSAMAPTISERASADPQLNAKLRLMGAVIGADVTDRLSPLAPESAEPSFSDERGHQKQPEPRSSVPFVGGLDEASNIFDSHAGLNRGNASVLGRSRSALVARAFDSHVSGRDSFASDAQESGDVDSAFQDALARLDEGSEEAAWDLIQEYGPYIERVVRRRMDQRLRSKFDSQDFVQMVWASFFRHRSRINQFTCQKELVRHLAAMAKNKVIDAARRGQTQKHGWNREQAYYTDSGHEHAMDGERPTPSQYAMARECWNRMMSSESERNQRIVRLRIAGLTFEEIGAELGLHERTVRRVIERLISKESGPRGEADS